MCQWQRGDAPACELTGEGKEAAELYIGGSGLDKGQVQKAQATVSQAHSSSEATCSSPASVWLSVCKGLQRVSGCGGSWDSYEKKIRKGA